MKIALPSVVLLALVLVLPARANDTSESTYDEAVNSFIFVFRSDFPSDQISPEATRLAAAHAGTVRHVFRTVIKGFSARVSAQGAARIATQNPHVAYYERNGIVIAIGNVKAAGKPGADDSAQVVPWGVSRVGGALNGTGRHAWVIDTGIDLNHPDLIVGSGANFVLRGKNTPDDGNGHGTHVAGTIAAIDNDIGVVGVAAGATVHPVRVLDSTGSGTVDAVVAGIDYVAVNASPARGDAVNLSLGAEGHFQSLHDAMVNAANLGLRFAIAAGNSASHAGGFEPAHVEHANIATVSAIDANDAFAYFSNFGNPPVDFAAPGVQIVSTAKGGGVTTMSGTSMAAPHVCGLMFFGPVQTSGSATLDPDGIMDPIAHR